ncbi:MAG TPA: MBOAT family O-acyltransferase [Chitinophagales bacterium]|nr:MBOAT family O-acyltransferase [Chitinophagales bacterium]
MSYTIEVYRGNQKPETNFGIYALYVMFYPQLVAGPIERPQNMLHQFYEKHHFEFERIKAGLMRMTFGFFKKVVIADRLAVIANDSFNDISNHNGLTVLFSTVAFSFQIYCDFSGYSDIALGCAQILGFKLMENFNAPYFAESISEFWSRWHISLSTWFRDYVYIPLGGNRVKEYRWYFNLMVVFILSGFWHGANWKYMVWGGLHGFYLIFANIKNKALRKLRKTIMRVPFYTLINQLIVFVLVAVAWIFFRANSFHDSLVAILKIISLNGRQKLQLSFNSFEIMFSVLLVLLLLVKEKYVKQIPTNDNIVFFTLFSMLGLLCYLFGYFSDAGFIYFQF